VEAANANIGIARAAFFPAFNLSGITGFQSKTLSNILSKPSLFWSIGPVSALTLIQPIAVMTLFDGGRLLGLLRQANATYFETVAIKQLDQENQSQTAATLFAKRSLIQAQHRYTGGIITFLEVVVVENTLQTELSEVNIRTRRHLATVQLIKALGGGWFITPVAKPNPH
jgi:outer membrane protein TolC